MKKLRNKNWLSLCISLFLVLAVVFSSLAYMVPTSVTKDPKLSGTITVGSQKFTYTDINTKESNASKLAKASFKTRTKLPTLGTTQELLRFMNDNGLFYSQSQMPDTVVEGTEEEAIEEPMLNEEASADVVAPTATSAGGEPEFSTTNTQVQGVDEGDIVKTDGKYIYAASSNQNKISIAEVKGSKMKRVSTIQFLDYANARFNEMYVSGDYLVAVLSSYSYGQDAYNNGWYDYRGKTIYNVYDIKDRANPVVARTFELRGDAVSTRLIGNTLYFIAEDSLPRIPFASEIKHKDILPTYCDSVSGKDSTTIMPANISICPGQLKTSYVLVGGFDITDKKAVDMQAFLGAASDIYMNKKALYIAQPSWDNLSTRLYRFSVSGSKLAYEASGEVSGHILNQYSMDEYDNHFRIATTTQDWGSAVQSTNSVYVLNQDMKITGGVENLAPGERIYAVRFMSETGYVVTYQQVDPLFVLDLSDAEAPRVVGELKIPGFSQYLHPIADGIMVGIGRNTQPTYTKDSSGKEVIIGTVDRGLKLSMFDVSNPQKPKEIYTHVIGSDGSTSSAVQNNPRALMVDNSKNYLGFPVTQYGSVAFNGCIVVEANPEIGFSTKAELQSNSGTYSDNNNRLCYIGDTLYMISLDRLTAYNYGTFKEEASIVLF